MEKKIERIQYEAPKIERLGTLTELTKVGVTSRVEDAIFGSVTPGNPNNR